jgi:hypothetical protein
MAGLAVVVNCEGIKLAKMDIKGALIQTKMNGPPVYKQCHKKLTELIIEILPKVQGYVCKDVTVYCHLMKALYGCVHASKA